jgi:predicted kinase
MEAVIFVGIQGSGKSTFYRDFFFNTHIRINLDMLKSRHREQILLQACIRAQQRFVIDNTNVLRQERARYIVPAKAAGFRIIGYYFQSTVQEAIRRNSQRVGKAIIPIKGIWGTYKRLQAPGLEEGFDMLYNVSINSTNEFVVQEWPVRKDFDTHPRH